MELLAINEQKQFEEKEVAGLDLAIDAAQLELKSLEGEARSVFFNLLKNHPFHKDVFWFYSTKEKLAYDIAVKIKYLATPDELSLFEGRLSMAFDIFESILISFEERSLSKKIFNKVLKGQSKEDFINAFKVIEKTEEVQKRSEGFRMLFADSVQYVIDYFMSI